MVNYGLAKTIEERQAYHREWYARNRDRELAKKRAWNVANAEKLRASRRKWVKKNPEEMKAARRSWVVRNRDRFNAIARRAYHKDPEKSRRRSREWDKKNPEKRRAMKLAWQKKSPKYKVAMSLRGRVYQARKRGRISGSGHSIDLLGCSFEEHNVYLESKFTPEMSWANYGIYWEIDHIIPLFAFTPQDRGHYYTNTQPLSIVEHRQKTILDRQLYSGYLNRSDESTAIDSAAA